MLPRHHPDRTQITFDDRRLVNNAGLLLPATLALHLGRAPGLANTGDKMMTLVASARAGGNCTSGAPAHWAARSRRPPRWAPTCAAFAGATSVNWTG